MLSLTEVRERYKDYTFRLKGVHCGIVLLVGEDRSSKGFDRLIDLRYDSTHVLNRSLFVSTPPIHHFAGDDTSAYDIKIAQIPQPSQVSEVNLASGNRSTELKIVYTHQT